MYLRLVYSFRLLSTKTKATTTVKKVPKSSPLIGLLQTLSIGKSATNQESIVFFIVILDKLLVLSVRESSSSPQPLMETSVIIRNHI